jgi:hypothetical protein
MKVGDLVKTTRGYLVVIVKRHIIEDKLKYVDVMYSNGYISIGNQLDTIEEVLSESR